MSASETLPRSGSSAVEETQPLDLEGLEATDERTARLDTPRLDTPRHDSSDERTRVQPVPAPPADAAERERRRREREKALGTRRKNTEPEPAPVAVRPKRTTDKFLGSVGLLLLRLVTAAIIGIHGYAKAMDIGSVQQMLNNTVIPEPVIMSYVLTASEVAIALALVLGLLTRLAGLGLAAITIGALVFVKWVQNPFTGNALSGELELLLGAVGLLLLCVGAGGASVDAAFRRRRAAAKS